MKRPRHECGRLGNGRFWMTCSACTGRIHLKGCTTRRNPKKDCCKKRHENLAAAGQTRGIADSSVPMLPYQEDF
jgi:hypothetical protein